MQDMGLKVFSNNVLRKPVLCNEGKSDMEDYPGYFEHGVAYDNSYSSGKSSCIHYLWSQSI